MMDLLTATFTLLSNLPTYLLNGMLFLLYWMGESGAGLASLVCALLLMRFVDPRLQKTAAYRPGRSGREGGFPTRRTAQGMTALVLLTWLGSQWGMGAPVPWLGAAMWIAGTLVLLAVRVLGATLLWNVKAGIAVYALAVLGSRVYLAYTATLSPAEWAALLGSAQSAAALIAGTRGSLTTIILWALWLVIPLGFFAMLIGQVLGGPFSLVDPLAGAGELIQRYRARGREDKR